MRKGYNCFEPKQMPAFYPWKAEGQCLLSTPGRGGCSPPLSYFVGDGLWLHNGSGAAGSACC